MSNSPVSALVLVGLAGVAGVIAWMAAADEPISSEADVVNLPSAGAQAGPRVMSLTPHERRLQGRLEGARRELERYKREGTVLDNGAIVVPDIDGTPLYIHPELIEGKGRYGEPLYAMGTYKKRQANPVRKEIKSLLPEKHQPKLGRAKNPIRLGKKPGSDGPTEPAGMTGGAGGGENKGGKGKKGKGKPKDG